LQWLSYSRPSGQGARDVQLAYARATQAQDNGFQQQARLTFDLRCCVLINEALSLLDSEKRTCSEAILEETL
jgi:hypothetical protein